MISTGVRVVNGTVVIHTSDRSRFKRCRRKWGWESPVRGNREETGTYVPFFIGSGIHFALEDFHGYNRFMHPAKAFEMYMKATKASAENRGASWLPEDIVQETMDLGCGMLDYYEKWIANRNHLRTLWKDGVPQVEVTLQVDITEQLVLPPALLELGIKVYYQGTLDRVVIDEYGNPWILDYKTAKTLGSTHLILDQQISAYCWLAAQAYGDNLMGMIIQQHLKDVPKPPEFLHSKRKFSVDKKQRTTHTLYREALLKLYGDARLFPSDNIRFLNDLAMTENEDGDLFVRREKAYRNREQIQAEGEKILMEVEEMLNPDLPLYPTPTRDCMWDCRAREACISLDDGSDWEFELNSATIERPEEDTTWRQMIQWPEAPKSTLLV